MESVKGFPEKSMEHIVAMARSSIAGYGDLPQPVPAPEFSAMTVASPASAALRDLFRNWKLDDARFGQADWNPLAEWIPVGSRVLLKPNFVLHENQSGSGLECLITHPSLIEAVLRYVALCQPSKVAIGDAPLQGCDFEKLRTNSGLDTVLTRLRKSGIDVSLVDFRRTILEGGSAGGRQHLGSRDLNHFVLFDLGRDSLLEELSIDAEAFRVTMYNPDLLRARHTSGKHQYLIAREVMEADVVINLPKLKSHKKACLTGALKNMIGMNGNKEFLPHHRKGGSERGGDCYAGGSWFKDKAETLLDMGNRASSGMARALCFRVAEMLTRAASYQGNNRDLEGSWYGNDTIWRTCLDLQRILYYGGEDASLSDRRRRVIHICDAIVGGEGEGPLANTPVPSRFLTGGINSAAVEWVNARLMGFDPEKIPLLRHSFDSFPYPLVDFAPEAIEIWDGGQAKKLEEVGPIDGRRFVAPAGWQGACELQMAEYDTTLA